MFTFFNSESLWIGNNMQEFNRIRNILDDTDIPYKYKTRSHMNQMSGRGGTRRSVMGSFGNPSELLYEYEIIVYKKDMDKAQYKIRR